MLPTYLEFAGLQPDPALDARSLWPLLNGTETDHRPCYAEVDISPQNPALLSYNLRSLQVGDWKYIYVIDAPALNGLYHLPNEMMDRSAEFPQRAADFKTAIMRYFRLHQLYAPIVLR